MLTETGCVAYLSVKRAVSAVLAQLSQVCDQPPGEAQGVFGDAGEALARRWHPLQEILQKRCHVAPKRLTMERNRVRKTTI